VSIGARGKSGQVGTRKRRLLTIGHSYVVRLNRRLVVEMSRLGQNTWEIDTIAPRYVDGDIRPIFFEEDPEEDETIRCTRVGYHLSRWMQLAVYGPEVRAILCKDWDLVHSWQEPYMFSGGQIAWWTPKKTPLVFWTAQNIAKTYPPPFSWIERYTLGRAAGWLACGQTTAEAQLQRGYGERPHAVLPLGVDTDVFRPDQAARESVFTKLEWSDSSASPVIGYLGRFVTEKGVSILTSALDALEAPWRALFVGTGPMEGQLRSWARSRPDHVRIVTNVPHSEVPAYLNAMDILCAPSQTTRGWREQHGRMLTEALACGVPVVASDSGEIPHVMGDTGVVLPESDIASWIQTLATLIEDTDRRAELSHRGIERIRQHFTWPIIAKRHLDFFETVL